jgi:hypothetical protein
LTEPSQLAKRWVHSHEEDTDDEMVFRPSDHALPRSRGRETLDLRADGTYLEHGIGADDRPVPADGTWQVTDDHLRLESRGEGGGSRVLEIAHADTDRLVIRK